jgi:flagellar motor switch protein FliM
MDRVLSQQEIDAIVNATRRGQAAVPMAPQKVVQACNFRTASQLSNEHARAISALHESFARNVAHSLGAYLRVSFSMVLSSLEQLTYGEYLRGLSDGIYLVPLHLQPLDISSLVQIDISLIFPIIDVLLGGTGAPMATPKEMTEIDEDIMGGVIRIIANQLQTTWEALDVEITLDRCQKVAQVQTNMPPTERVLLLTFEIAMAQNNGAFHLLVPGAFANAILRKAPNDKQYRKSRVRYLPGPDLRQRLMNCDFDTWAGISGLRMKVRDLISLKPGKVLPLPAPITHPASLLIGGREIFDAAPVRNGNKRAAQLLQPVQPTLPEQQDQLA